MHDAADDTRDQDQQAGQRSQPVHRVRGKGRRGGQRRRGDRQQQRPTRDGQRIETHQRRDGDQLRGAGQQQRRQGPDRLLGPEQGGPAARLPVQRC